jgi:hypothetical protein
MLDANLSREVPDLIAVLPLVSLLVLQRVAERMIDIRF